MPPMAEAALRACAAACVPAATTRISPLAGTADTVAPADTISAPVGTAAPVDTTSAPVGTVAPADMADLISVRAGTALVPGIRACLPSAGCRRAGPTRSF